MRKKLNFSYEFCERKFNVPKWKKCANEPIKGDDREHDVLAALKEEWQHDQQKALLKSDSGTSKLDGHEELQKKSEGIDCDEERIRSDENVTSSMEISEGVSKETNIKLKRLN